MTVYKMITSGNLPDKSILLIDSDSKKKMIEPGVFGKTDLRLGNNQLLKNGIWLCLLIAIFVDLELNPTLTNRIIASDFTAKYLI
jgi:hypothetical protein